MNKKGRLFTGHNNAIRTAIKNGGGLTVQETVFRSLFPVALNVLFWLNPALHWVLIQVLLLICAQY